MLKRPVVEIVIVKLDRKSVPAEKFSKSVKARAVIEDYPVKSYMGVDFVKKQFSSEECDCWSMAMVCFARFLGTGIGNTARKAITTDLGKT
ncbi:hypothetical protein KIN20_019234 [Parelaphostrongylus tenuis]|uniref:Uncharacterized protein n=1 Tax=Parelaphostrongylus tenuis TaxID=148309 RepID=A0AAD5MKN8_PARTN|nr:hypothetical protein KIN20_019234 [Parelaphostrongylus tenuis]